MENRKSREISRQSLTGKPIKRDKDYYLNNMDIEAALHKTAVSMAERMFTAFIRENNIEVSLDTDDLTDKIIKKLLDKLPKNQFFAHPVSQPGSSLADTQEAEFSFDDTPVILKADKIEIKGNLAKTRRSEDSISDSLDALKDLEI